MKCNPRCLHLLVMNVMRSIIIVIVSITYLMPSTGFYYVKHYCEYSGISKIVWHDEYSCHESAEKYSCCESDHEIEKQHSCCESDHEIEKQHNNYLVEVPDENCCDNEIHYVKDSSVYDEPAGKSKTKINIQTSPNIVLRQDQFNKQPAILSSFNHSPPDNKSSGSLYITYQSMIL